MDDTSYIFLLIKNTGSTKVRRSNRSTRSRHRTPSSAASLNRVLREERSALHFPSLQLFPRVTRARCHYPGLLRQRFRNVGKRIREKGKTTRSKTSAILPWTVSNEFRLSPPSWPPVEPPVSPAGWSSPNDSLCRPFSWSWSVARGSRVSPSRSRCPPL